MSVSLQVGMTFPDGQRAREAVEDFALGQRRQVVVDTRGGNNKRMVCSSKRCGFFVQLYKRSAQGVDAESWFVSSFCLDHVNCTSIAKPTCRQLRDLPAFRQAVVASPDAPASVLIATVRQACGLDLSQRKSTVYRARDMVANESRVSSASGYSKVPSLLRAFQDSNPGSYTAVDADAEGRFTRAFIACGVIVNSVPHNQQIAGIDCAHLTSSDFTGLQMILVGRDGNLSNIFLAVALVDAETAANYSWFISCARASGIPIDSFPLFCDRNAGLLSVGHAEGLMLRYCTLHIMRNLLAGFKHFTHNHKALIWALQAAKWEDLFNSNLEIVRKECGDDVEQYIRSIPPDKWALYPTIGHVKLYGWRTTNFVESVNGATLLDGLRRKSPLQYLDGVMQMMMTAAFTRSVDAAKWLSAGREITPKAQGLLYREHRVMGEYVVAQASAHVAFVFKRGKNPSFRRRVDLFSNQCTCMFMDQFGIPCRHMIAVLAQNGELDAVFSRFAWCYKVSHFAEAFHAQSVMLPLLEDLEAKPMRPAVVCPTPGRKCKKRIRSRGEGVTTKTYRCKNCKQIGHNRRTCTLPAVEYDSE